MDLRASSKVDLHRHLEGAVRPGTIIELYREAGTPLAETTPEELAPVAQVLRPMGSLAEVLAYFRVAQEAFRSLDAVERVASEAVEDLAADNVRLAELRFSPDFLCRSAGLDWDEAFGAILAGVARAREVHDVEVGFIAIAGRWSSPFGTGKGWSDSTSPTTRWPGRRPCSPTSCPRSARPACT